MRLIILVSLSVLLASACVFHHEEGTGTAPGSATKQPVAATTTPATTPAGEEGPVDPAELSELIVDEAGKAQWKEIPLPQGWPEIIPLVEDARIVYRERAIHKVGVSNHIVVESQVPVDEAGAFYINYFTGLGWRRLDTSRGPQFYNCTFLDADQLVDVNIHHVPEENPGMEQAEALGEETDFEGTVIKILIMPAGDLSYFKGAVAWYSLDDVPPGFPLDEAPRFPGGIVDMASFAPGDHVVLQQHIPETTLADLVKFYRDFYLGQGLEIQVNEDGEEFYQAEFSGEGFFVRVSATRYASAETGYCDIYKQITATE